MHAATNLDATAVNTIRWLSAAQTSIVVPVYQRQYRWDIGGCEQLLADIRAVADSEDQSDALPRLDPVHRERRQRRRAGAHRRAAADHHADAADRRAAAHGRGRRPGARRRAAEGAGARRRPDPHQAAPAARPGRRCSRPSCSSRRPAGAELRDSRFDDNYAFFRSQVPAEEAPRIWRGLQRLEHVSITLGADANAQQIFESLNSTGEPLRDHELIHNYMLMGLSHPEQREIEDAFWVPIEENTGESIGSFWRHYLVMTTGREIDTGDGRGVYDTFRHEFPRFDFELLREHATEWREYCGGLPHPARPGPGGRSGARPPARLRQHVRPGHVPARDAGLPRLHAGRRRQKATLVGTLERIQSLLLRRTVVGLSNDRLVARLCRARRKGPAKLVTAIARITPSDERVRVALKYGALPHPAYVLGRLADVDSLDGLDVEHDLPAGPRRRLERRRGAGVGRLQRGRAEQPPGPGADARQPRPARAAAGRARRRRVVPARSAHPSIRRARSPRPGNSPTSPPGAPPRSRSARRGSPPTSCGSGRARRPSRIDDDGLTPILDAQRRRGWPRGWEREFEYVEYRGEHWEVHDVKYLFNRVFKRLWADAREDVVAFSARRGGPIFEAQAWNGHWDRAGRNPLPLHGLGLEVHAHRGAGRAGGVRPRLRGVREVLLHRRGDVATPYCEG